MSDPELVALLTDIRNWLRAASYPSIKALLLEALPDEKSRSIYQMLDGKNSVEQIRTSCKASPNSVVALAQRCVSMGLIETTPDKKKIRLFDLADFGIAPAQNASEEKNHK